MYYNCNTYVTFFITNVSNRYICVMAKKVKYNRIKEILARDDKTQTWLAEQIGKSRVVVSNYVNNNTQPSIEVLFEIAKVLKVKPTELLNG